MVAVRRPQETALVRSLATRHPEIELLATHVERQTPYCPDPARSLSVQRAGARERHRHITTRRVERARALLVERAMPASEVALSAGFSHQSHMARWMRRLLGVTPRELVDRVG